MSQYADIKVGKYHGRNNKKDKLEVFIRGGQYYFKRPHGEFTMAEGHAYNIRTLWVYENPAPTESDIED